MELELTEIISLDPNDLNEDSRDEVFEALRSIENIDIIPRKSLRKTLAVCLAIMKHKGEEVEQLKEQLEAKTQPESPDESISDRIQEENEKLKRMVNKLEEDKNSLKSKIKDMNEETLHLQKRLAEAVQSTESDKESSDPLSELDRQEELLKNINTKNKHIKRLLREIEALQTNNIEQSKAIIDVEQRYQQAKIQLQELNAKIALLEGEKQALSENVNELNAELMRLENNITYLEDERDKSETELKLLIEKLETKAKTCRSTIQEKDKEIKKLKAKLESFPELSIHDDETDDQKSDDDKQRLVEESTRMMHAIELRDKIIEKMESKIKAMAEEMISSTRLMNKLSAEREDERSQDSKRSRPCCKTIEETLKASTQRCRELSELLDKSEEDNLLKSHQATQAICALDAYQRGEDGLPKALRKISSLEQKLIAREKQIRGLVNELNSMHEVSSENALLRKRLNIPDDVMITAKNLVAKERSKDKQIERLTLKLRASEEMRLQLKLEKNDLRRELLGIQQISGSESKTTLNGFTGRSTEDSPEKQRPDIYCDNCLKNIQTLPDKDTVIQDVIKDWETKYSDVVEENENLRVGMHEILEKIREYDSTSDHITIDCEILERLLHALDARSISGWYHPAMRIQNELIALKEREHALREKINEITRKEDSSSIHESIDSIREVGEVPDSPVPPPTVKPFDSSTRPTTPNKALDQSLYPVIVEADKEHESMKTQFLKMLEKNRSLQQEVQRLQVFQAQFNELTSQMASSENNITQYCSGLVEKLSALEIEMNTKTKAYEFLKEDLDRTLSDFKVSETKNMALIADLKKQVNDRRHDINHLEEQKNELLKKTSVCNVEEYRDLQRSLYTIQSQMASLVNEILSGQVEGLKIEGISVDYGVIQENLQLEVITVEEYEAMEKEKLNSAAREKDLKIKCEHLESLLSITKEQVTSQQKLLTDITDNHINLRHLVADLQSSSEDKFLIAKIQRELDSAKKEVSQLKLDRDNYEQKEDTLKSILKMKEQELEDLSQSFQSQLKSLGIKNKFFQKALENLRQKYFKFTPLVFLTNFVYAYAKFAKRSKEEKELLQERLSKQVDEILSSKISLSMEGDKESQDTIKLIKSETRAKYLEDQVQAMNQKNLVLQTELNDLRLSAVSESEHWKTIDALFGGDHSKATVEREVQAAMPDTVDFATNTEKVVQLEEEEQDKVVTKVDQNLSPITSPTRKEPEKSITTSETQTSLVAMTSKQTSPIASPTKQPATAEQQITESKSVQVSPEMEQSMDSRGIQTSPVGTPKRQPSIESDPKLEDMDNQLKMASALAEERKILLEKTEAELQEIKKTVEEIQRKTQEQEEQTQKERRNSVEEKTTYQAGVIEKTILSFHSLLSEKDKSINQYQELLNAERTQNLSTCAKFEKEIQHLVSNIADLHSSIKAKDEEILELKTQMQASSAVQKEKGEIASGVDDNADNSLQEISDEKIEEMFDDGISEVSDVKPIEPSKEMFVQEIANREKFWKNAIKSKDEEIVLLKEKLCLYQEKEKMDMSVNPEMEQLRVLLDEKDKHINDLMDTLNNFHDDQQRFLKDSSTYTGEQISKLASNLTRCEATNKIYQAQLEALRRQLANLNQREKQARDLNNTLRNQLIKRPVVSIKTELNARLKSENLQKKIAQLEADLDEAHIQIKRQQVILDAKRAKTNNEVGLWEKQKRWQQNAEKFKAKLEETEAVLEKQKTLLHSARTTIARLEKDKQILEAKVGKGSNVMKCCRTPSCPNLHATKYTPSETPETYTGGSECSSPARRMYFCNNQGELIEALKARIEMQQRKIIAMEMEGKGSNELTTELEKLQEKCSATEAQNIRLEARNLQLQLDNDLLRQGDSGERMQKRVKHLEDYIIALKEELAQTAARAQLHCDHKPERKYAPGQAEQTILSLRSIIEKLKVDNKNLMEGRKICGLKDHDTPAELTKLQHMYTESLDKISALQIELQLKARCPNCGSKGQLETYSSEELRLIKEQLLKKTQLLEKAKILLTRAAAKEKVLKEQLALWKRKCSELQNVPVIDEISE